MSRMALAAVSLVAAVPAAIMAILAILALLGSAGDMSTLVLAVTGGATAVGVLVALLPIVILVGKRKTKAAPAKVAKESPVGVSGAQTAEVVGAEDELVEHEDTEMVPSGDDIESFGESDDTEAFDSAEDIAATDDFRFEDDAFLEGELADSEPEPEPKKKKKR
jgi:hypothetical protein